jgi:Rrf2 family nitric oxide-sensitive transcriptional repressor
MFSMTTEYAMRAMACLAMRPTQLVSATVLAEQTKVPSNYLAKVLQQLASANLIDGRRGVGGGYKLARSADQINLLDVINAVAKVSRIEVCPLGLKNHGHQLCPLHRRTDQAAAAVIEIFGKASLKDLISDPGNINKPLCDEKMVASLTINGATPTAR